jgi:hypothetical protein
MNYWLFYAGPENFLDRTGARQFAGSWKWSCTPEVASGDLAILYRRSLAKTSVAAMVEVFGMSAETAQAVRHQAIGSDLAAVWRVTSGNLGSLHDWEASCDVQHIADIKPPIALRELKAVPALRKWEDLRWNFQAQGRAALSIPDFAWAILNGMIGQRVAGKPDVLQ